MKEIRMNRHFLTCVLFAVASATLSAQQSSPSDPYQGTSNPPSDDTIETSAPAQAKPPAGKPMVTPPAAQQAPESQPQPTSVDPSANYPAPGTGAGTDGGVVQVAPQSGSASAFSGRSYTSDPDGDIVHPRPLGPGQLGEGATIRVRLLDRLSTADSEKGEPFHSRVVSDVLEGGQVVIPAGAEIDGRVVEVSTGHTGGHGSMRLRPEAVVLPNGTRFRLDAQLSGTPGSRARVGGEGTVRPDSRIKRDSIEYGGAVGTGVVAGAILGGPVGALTGGLIGAGAITVHLLVNHPQATLERGSTLLFTLIEPLNLVAANAPGN
jgi:hypothetical protein